ncbi:MAG: hypothetical protein ABIZ49_08390 [Opitutaceae bacterium]
MKPLLTALALTALALATSAFAVEYQATKDWVRLPDVNSRPTNSHGDVAISSAGEVYVSTMDPENGIQVFSQDGKLLRSVPNAPNDFHGFVIRKDKEGEFIYGPRLVAGSIVKLTLDGKVVLEIPGSAIPDEFKNVVPPNTRANAQGEITKNPDEGKRILRMTGIDVAPNGDIYVTDGYASDYVHRFDRNGKYLKSFGGKKEPYNFRTLHKLAIDTRFTPARIIAVDREARRVIHLSLDGELLGVVAKDMLRPSALAIQGDYVVIGEILGQVTVLDKAGKVVAAFATNSTTEDIGHNRTPPEKWRPGMVNSPHGVAFNANGDIFVTEYNTFGRVHRFDRK